MSIPEKAEALSTDEDSQALETLLDQLIPGDGVRWPEFSCAVDLALFASSLLDVETRRSAFAWSDALRPMDTAGRLAFLKARETDETARFAALLTAAHRAYYTAPSVLADIRAMAEAGPREPSALFDPSLVEDVLARGAGKRRL